MMARVPTCGPALVRLGLYPSVRLGRPNVMFFGDAGSDSRVFLKKHPNPREQVRICEVCTAAGCEGRSMLMMFLDVGIVGNLYHGTHSIILITHMFIYVMYVIL